MASLEAFYFPSGDRSLFGVYQGPAGGLPPRAGITFCYPVGDEYVRFHRACRQLAIRLTRAGFGVLRFDYTGCGDASGDLEEASVEQWTEDVGAAIRETKTRAGTDRMFTFGLRVGASLAAMATAESDDEITGAVLWDPVVRGADYLGELRTLHADMLAYSHVIPRPAETPSGITEIVGFPFTDALLADLEAIDLTSLATKPADATLLVESNPAVDLAGLAGHVASLGARADHQPIPMPDFWKWMEDYGKVLVPNQIIQPVVDWVSGVCA